MGERRRISGRSPFEGEIGFSRAVRVGGRVLVAGTAPVWEDGTCDPDPELQARRCIEIIERVGRQRVRWGDKSDSPLILPDKERP